MMLMKALLALAGQRRTVRLSSPPCPGAGRINPVEGVRYVTRNEAGEPVVKCRMTAVLKEATESPRQRPVWKGRRGLKFW